MKLVSIGEITLDHYLNLGTSLVGGISLNFAVHAKRAGAAEVALISRVGREDGQPVLAKLQREAINSSHVQRMPGKTARIDIQVLADGERIFPEGGYHANVLKDFKLSPAEYSFIQQHDVLACGFDPRPHSVFQQLRSLEFAGRRVLDFGDWQRRKKDLAAMIDSLEQHELSFISGDDACIAQLLPFSAKDRLIVVTLGAKGSAALIAGQVIRQKAKLMTRAVDSTGCGDAFQAAFCICYLETADISKALEQGSQQAARVLQHYGAS